MKRPVSLFIIFVLAAAFTNSHAMNVNTTELKDAERVEFINYTGPKGRGDSVRDVISIGAQLAAGSENTENRVIRFFDKYSIIRAISETDMEKLNADIFIIEDNARVNNIRFVRHMLTGYMQERFGYSAGDARTIALFVTYYNAVYRSNMEFFNQRYKPVVMQHVSAADAGIDTHYSNWPGKTRMLIPLTDDPLDSSITSIDPTRLTDKSVRDEIRKDSSLIPERKKMVELQEKSIDKEKTALEKEREDIERERREAEKKKREIEDEKKEQEAREEEIRKKEDEIRKDKKEADKITDPDEKKEKEREIARKEREIEEEKDKLKEDEKITDDASRELEKKEDEIVRKEETAEKKDEEITRKEDSVAEQKKEIAEDELKGSEADRLLAQREREVEKKEAELKKREDEIKEADSDRAIIGDRLYYLKRDEWLKNGHYNNELFMINTATFEIIKKSPVPNIGGRNYIAYNPGIVVITHTGRYSQAYHLTLIDRETLELVTKGSDNIFWRSFVELNNGFIYAVVFEDKKYYLGKFNDRMEMVARSDDEVVSDTFISFFKDRIYINGKGNRIMVLKEDDLSLIDSVRP